ncbi:MAG: 30S ribosomal protein S8 [Candidatus Wildermuthbacteria bacterium]|nr:30S ribosomal protein S8 [Candidatus Wildermuthbacteria bacterium]
MTDPIADMLNRIKNAYAVKKPTVDVAFSNMALRLAKALEQRGYIKGVETRGKRVRKTLEIALKYKEGLPAVSGIKRVSKPGQKIYAGFDELRKVKGGIGMAIISTSKGLITDAEAKKEKIGGEILCEIW